MMVYFNCIRTLGNCLSYKKSLSFSIVKPTRCPDVSNLFSSSIGTTAHCGFWPIEQCPSIFSYLPPTLSIFSLPPLEDSFHVLFPSFPGSFPSSRPFQFLNEDLFGYPILLHSNLFYFGVTLYMFRTIFPSIIRSSRLYVQQQAFVKQILLSAC